MRDRDKHGWRYFGYETAEADAYNPSDFCAYIGPLAFWTATSVMLHAAFNFGTFSGLYFQVSVPYLHIRLTLIPWQLTYTVLRFFERSSESLPPLVADPNFPVPSLHRGDDLDDLS